ncbi:pyridoxal-phosphate dependent enzyme [Thermanaerothrix sp. 4228-RoL]|uniref:Pyridoxal-phosphate dependent enzyme n=1 Tax=Thermanaerothrix solaris TaxID=3058434 RepID=A0ABU3NSG3_9CHLR|nr:pyridoxal-phosphate dependent enzyme [Thermanaerothrix sp. 4228-RoL]MDT8899148.1 pyridoxal-phosphate dependent enzyme [Thermanaerothrix sp. 4228-RoL]
MMLNEHCQIECLDCGFRTPYHPLVTTCSHCGGTWLKAVYDYAHLSHALPSRLKERPFDLWRYRELLPVMQPAPELRLSEGGTPLIRALNLGMMLGLANLFMKDERQGPTSSFKDRQAALSISALKTVGVREVVLASTGNVAIAYSAYAARAGIKLWAFLTSLVPAAKMREVALYGTQVIKVTGSYDQAKQVAAEFARQRGIYLDAGARSIANIESMKTIAYEIAEQLGEVLNESAETMEGGQPRWQAPDWYIQAVSGGMGPLGVLKGFREMYEMGWIDKIPKIGVIQVEGCAPMVNAWKQGRDTAIPVQSPRTNIATLATGDPGRTYTLLRNWMLEGSGGAFESVSDEEAYRAIHFLAKMEGMSVEPAAAVACAGLIKLVRSGQIKPHEVVVMNISGHTLPVERAILGEGWSRNVVVSEAIHAGAEEGLLAALSKITIDRFPRIAIVDDHPEARRLIRRILQSQGEYTLYEAASGREAIELAQRERPDLIILDLMMPEIDGFGVIEALQAQPETAEIPIIVVTAKELTPAEKDRLRGHIQSLMQKGDFMSDDLLDEVRALLK